MRSVGPLEKHGGTQFSSADEGFPASAEVEALARPSGLGDAVAGPRGDDDRTARRLGRVEHGALADLAGLVETLDFGCTQGTVVKLRLPGDHIDSPEGRFKNTVTGGDQKIAEAALDPLILMKSFSDR
ncbi:hypothetical protein [Methylocaldum sp. RMAD-M]|uniref:hypothetical protein n=1 Tax=Methylocaldum sp. RMAD-M TaxID=2806557 RepID=UPI0012EB30BA|nr:hypothetical protein [Methylocaldum sp. RMAD-M]MBP1153071.1 hypothetical protein [Methylocaldum sp. RMAD-M]MVF24143.1 hypothetical protein [Methylocaldum sp. BRCS4]